MTIGEHCRCLSALIDQLSANEMRNRLEYLANWL
jgi:hypothetical protein